MIYLVRHGETEFNRERRIQGRFDSPLTARGVRQAEAVGRLLAARIGDPTGWRLIASPLGRAEATARIVSAHLGLPVELDARLQEISWGPFDGRLRSELEAEFPETFARSGWAFDAPSGEPYEAVAERIGAWIADLPPEPERRVIAVSHGVSGRVLRAVYAGLPRDLAAKQDVPQDAVFRLAQGMIDRFDCEPLEDA